VFFLRDDKRGNSAMQTARDPGRGDWDPARAANLRAVDDADKPLEIVWEYEWFHAVPDEETAGRLIQELRAGIGKQVRQTRLLRVPGEFGRLLIDEMQKPEAPLSIDRYHDTDPMTWGVYDALLEASAADAWCACKRRARRDGWIEPPADRVLGGYNIIHGSTIRQRYFGDLSQRWHTGAMNIEPFYRRPAPGLGERLEYNFYLHPDGGNELDLDVAIAAGRAHPELRATSGFHISHLALEQLPGLRLEELRPRVQISKTRRKFLLKNATTGEIQIIINVDRVEAVDLQSRVTGTAAYFDVDVSAEGDVLKEPVLQLQQRFVRQLQRTWGLCANDRTRQDRAECQLRRLAEQRGRRTARFYATGSLPLPTPAPGASKIVATAQKGLIAMRGGKTVRRLAEALAQAEQLVMRGESPAVSAARWARAGSVATRR
jgi:hypothetical protein